MKWSNTGYPTVSVIIPCYNMEKYIRETMLSVVRQTFTDWEMILVDDGSSDRTYETIKALSDNDHKIKNAAKETHSGIADTRNQCIQMAEGRYLAFLDADDLWRVNKLEYQLEVMQRKNLGFTYTAYDCVDEQGAHTGKVIKTAGDLGYKDYLRNTIIGCSTVMVDRALVGEVHVPNFRTSEDAATWLDILRKGHKSLDRKSVV